MALRGIATQSETFINTAYTSSPFVASHANDGNIEASMTATSGACSIVQRNPPVWWQVDLQKVHEITKVAITRWDKSGKPEHYFILHLNFLVFKFINSVSFVMYRRGT